MTIDEWAYKNSGIVLRIPAGTVTHHRWYYLENGEWTDNPKAWTRDVQKEYRAIKTDIDIYVELTIDAGDLKLQGMKAHRSKNGKSTDGPILLKKRRR